MTRWIATVDSKKTVRDAATIMIKSHAGSIIIVDEEKPIGIITEADISRALAEGGDPDRVLVRKAMSKNLITVSPDLRVEDAAKLMAEKQIKKLPVLEGGRLVGIVTD
jgi:CBS domain-containing protein